MKKSEFKRIIGECVQEILTEATLYQDVRNFLTTIQNDRVRNVFTNWIVPLLSKSADNVPKKLKYIAALRQLITDPKSAQPWIRKHVEAIGLDLNDAVTQTSLTNLLPILSNLKRFIETRYK